MRIGEDNYFFKLRQWKLNRKARKCFDNFGKNSEFRPGAYASYTENISIGDNVVIRPGCRLFADGHTFIIIEDNVLLGHGVHLYTNNHSFQLDDIPIVEQGYGVRENIILEDGCWIGANAIILPGVTIGQNAVVGAGSVVTKDVPAFTTVVGNPARKLRRIKDVERKEIPMPDTSKGRLFAKRKKHS